MSKAGLKVLVAADSRSFHVERFTGELRAQGCEVLIASLEAGSIEHVRLPGRGPVSTIAYTLAAGSLQKLIDRFQPDIINPHYAAGYGFMVSRLKKSPAPVVLHVWGSDILQVPQKSRLHRAKVMRALRAADMIVADSAYLAEAVTALDKKASPEIIPWGIEAEYLSHHRSDYALKEPLRIIVPRLHEPIYNNMLVVRALQNEIIDGRIRITFPAFGSRYESFRKEATALVGDRIDYYERLPRNEFIAFMATHDLYLSAAASDSSPVTLIEAMALGLIPVVGDIRGVDEWLVEGAGYRFSLDSVEELRSTIVRLVEGADDHTAMRRRNLGQAKMHGVFEDNMRRQVELFKRMINRRSGA